MRWCGRRAAAPAGDDRQRRLVRDSQEPWIHLALARLRAVEHRRFLVGATNSGVSAIVDPMGWMTAHTGLFTRENLRGVVAPLEGETLYDRLGDWPGWLAIAIVAVGLA